MSDDEPWWATQIRVWLAICQVVAEATHKRADDMRAELEILLETTPPMLLFKWYRENYLPCREADEQEEREERRRAGG